MGKNTYRIYIHSNEHPRTINTPMMGRCWYTCFEVVGRDAMIEKVTELVNAGKRITEVRYGYGGTVPKGFWMEKWMNTVTKETKWAPENWDIGKVSTLFGGTTDNLVMQYKEMRVL